MGTPSAATEMRRRLFALKGAGPLRNTSNSILLQLLESAQERTWDEGQPVCQQDQPSEGFFLLLEGALDVSRDDHALFQLRGGQVLGVESLVRGTFSVTATAVEPSRGLLFPREAVLTLADARAGLRRDLGLDELPPRSDPTGQHPPHQRAEVVTFASDVRGVPLSTLVGLLAKVMTRDFGDRVLVLRQGPEPLMPAQGADGVFYATVPTDVSADVVRAFVLNHSGEARFDYVFLDGFNLPGLDEDKTVWLVDRAPRPLQSVVAALAARRRSPAHRILPTVLIHPKRPPREQELHGRSMHERPVMPDSGLLPPCWMRLDWEALARLPVGDAPLERLALGAGTLDSLSRWARALTHRRVGVALSGGGVWGFYHVHILNWMVERHIPIDFVSSASMGSAVGGYFCATALDGKNGLDGLELLVKQAMTYRITTAALASIISTYALEWRVDRDLGDVSLGQLTTRFLPVASNLTTGLCTAMEEGPLALAVRASSSAPGIWAPTLLPPARFVDGAFTSNVPAEALLLAGADLTFAGNIFPFGCRSEQPLLPGTLGRFIAALNPVQRMFDLVASGVLLLHNSGDGGTQQADVGYDIFERKEPLLTASEFTRAKDIIKQAERDVVLAVKLEDLATRWEKLKRPGASRDRRSERQAA